jgi:hypothetical protein
MRGYRKTILTLAFAIAPLSAQQANKAPVCNPPGKDEVCFDARTTGSLGQMHVRKSKKLVVTHLNRIKNDYQLQRGITVQTAQTDLLSGLSFIPTAPANPPSTTSATTPQAGTGAATPPDQSKAQDTAAKADAKQFKASLGKHPVASGAPGARAVRALSSTATVYSADDATQYLNRYSETAADNIVVSLASGGFSAADLKTIRTAMTDAASAIVKQMKPEQVAPAMQNNTEQPFLDAIGKAEAAAYVASAPYIQHVQFPPLTAELDALSVRLTALQQDLFDLKDKVAKADRDLADALASAQSFAVASDSLDPTTMVDHLNDPNGQIMTLAAVANWPFAARTACNAETLKLKQDFAGLASLPGYADWKGTDTVKDRLTAFSSALDADTAYINGLNPDNNDRVTALGKAKAVLAHFQWIYSLKGTPDLTQIEDTFACNDDTQKADYTLIVNDLTDGKTAASVPVATFTCYAPLSLSGGIGFNSLAERTYQLVTPAGSTTTTSGTTPPSQIQYDKNSSFQIAPLLLLNVRLCNLQDWGALHASFGAGVTIPASGSGTTSGTGSQPTYLGGLSVSLRDKLYFTVGPFFGRTNTLANGYAIGSSLPSGVTTIPLQTKYSAGIGVAVTFKLK